jgi:hypothetical protein
MAQQHEPGVKATETVTGHTPGVTDTLTTPKATKKKRRYSRGLRVGQELERGVSRAAATFSDALAETFKTYKKRSRNSSLNKRDGAVRDAIKNWTKATSEGIKTASDAPYEFVKTINRGRASRRIRDAVRMISPPMFR